LEFSYEIFGILFTVALLAGFVDSISGGGGLIILPALMLSGFLPTEALGTNKLQGVFGKLSAVLYYRRQGMLTISSMKLPLLASFLGAAIGALAIQHIQSDFLAEFIPWLIAVVAIYFLFSPRIGDLDKRQRIHIGVFAIVITSSIGFYDGFFGPASGSLFALSFVSLLGYNLSKATAYTRLLLLATNSASLIVFIWGGNVIWRVGLCMAIGQWIGARYGSQAVMLKGSKLVKPMLVSVCFLLIFKMVILNKS
jgi:uncharacterized membrane protein YfcA